MYKILLLIVISLSTTTAFAQKPKEVAAATPAVPATVIPIVSTKELKRQLESNFKRKRYKLVIPIADTLLTRLKKDEKIFSKKISSEVFLKMDKQVIADLKNWYKNKDTAATIISNVPYDYKFDPTKRPGDIYYKAAIAWAPKNGVPYIYYAADLADAGKAAQALTYAKKGYAVLTPKYKTAFASVYSWVLYLADKKEEAYTFLENEIAANNNSEDVVNRYFKFYIKDKRYEDGIQKATEFIKKDSFDVYFKARAALYSSMGNSEKACEDAVTLRDRFSQGDDWLKSLECPQVMAPVKPDMQRTYIYEVIVGGTTYDFRVSNPKVDMDNGVSFKWKMTGDVGINGVVNITKDAIDTAHVQMNMFNKANYTLDTRTSVWVSNAVFNEIKTKGEVFMEATRASAQVFQVVNDDGLLFYKVQVDDQDRYIHCIHLVSRDKDDSQELWINDDPKNPLILKMKLDFSIELKQIL